MNFKNTCSLIAISMTLSVMPALADGNAFTPLNFDDTAYSVPNTTNTTNTTTSSSTAVKNNNGFVDATNVSTTQATGNADLQGAITKLDTALDAIRTDQNICKSKYAEVDNQYKFIKNERANLKKQVRANEKRIKQLVKAKENIGKNVLQ